MKAPGQRFLMIYSGVLTAVFVVTVASGFVASRKTMTLDQLDVQRINLREPDGTLRMVMSSKERAPGIYYKGKEFPHPMGRREAGFLFLNAEGTENGGLIFGGERGPDGIKNRMDICRSTPASRTRRCRSARRNMAGSVSQMPPAS
jgi:hypothetical protein